MGTHLYPCPRAGLVSVLGSLDSALPPLPSFFPLFLSLVRRRKPPTGPHHPAQDCPAWGPPPSRLPASHLHPSSFSPGVGRAEVPTCPATQSPRLIPVTHNSGLPDPKLYDSEEQLEDAAQAPLLPGPAACAPLPTQPCCGQLHPLTLAI